MVGYRPHCVIHPTTSPISGVHSPLSPSHRNRSVGNLLSHAGPYMQMMTEQFSHPIGDAIEYFKALLLLRVPPGSTLIFLCFICGLPIISK
jgi:hypothetical protein